MSRELRDARESDKVPRVRTVEKPPRSVALLALITTCALWGLSFPLMKTLALHVAARDAGVSSWFVASASLVVRFGLGALLLLLVMRPARPTRAELVQGLGLAVSSGFGMLFQMDGVSYTSASTSAFLTQGYVVILPIVAALGARSWPTPRIALCVLAICAGLGVLSRFDPVTLALGRGETETLLAACCFALQILILDFRRFHANRAGVVSVTMFACLAAVLTPVALLNARAPGDLRLLVAGSESIALLLLLCVPCTAFAFALMNRFQPAVSASEAGIVYGAEPVFTSAYALFLPALLGRFAHVPYANETPTRELAIGGGLVVVANVILQLPARRAAAG